MCGIAGIVAFDGVDPQALMDMTHLIRYRGPDGFGFAYTGAGIDSPVEIIHNQNRWPNLNRPVIGLGSRRLAILDVSSQGDMPMRTEDGDYTIVFNGEIYNYKEIREELRANGRRFLTGTDTEVILHAYAEWGQECLQRFNGMWSFALWDRPKRRLFCARDRFGVKPFYYALWEGNFYFGSEIKQVLRVSAMPRRANPHMVFDFLEWGLMDHSEDTFFEDVIQMPGGHSLTLDLSAPLEPKFKRYWDLRIQPIEGLTPDEATEEFQARFRNAVKIRLRSDVPVGVCLSGGLDSSAILCQAKKIEPGVEFQAFSACFDDKKLDEREYIQAAVAQVQGKGHQVFPRGQVFWDDAESLVFHHDEPLGSSSTFSQWKVMQTARENGVPVMLAGQGADEILCGYQKFRYLYLWQLLKAGDPRVVRELAGWMKNGTRRHGAFASAGRYLPAALRARFSPAERLCNQDFLQNHSTTQGKIGLANTLEERQKVDLTYSSIPVLLRHEDRNSMAHSIESRMPFLDYQLVEFAVNCPPEFKLRDGWSKWLLRNAMKGILPEKVRLRKTKLGFDAPVAEWMRFGLQNGHRDLWDAPQLKMERYLDRVHLGKECQKFLQGNSTALPADSLFRGISLELWAQLQNAS
jgi:asparagine synthase (glutamine-hydrolysing)